MSVPKFYQWASASWLCVLAQGGVVTKRPFAYVVLTALLLLVSLALLTRALLMVAASPWDFELFWEQISLHDKLTFFLMLVTALFSYQASRWLLAMVPIVLALLASNHALWIDLSEAFQFVDTRFAPYAAMLMFAPLATPSVWIPLKNPNLRWWRASRRYRRKISATLSPYVGEAVSTITYDISATGLFLKLSKESLSLCPKVGRRVRVNLCVDGMKSLRMEAEVVRVCDGGGQYPRGVGLRIISFDHHQDRSYVQLLTS